MSHAFMWECLPYANLLLWYMPEDIGNVVFTYMETLRISGKAYGYRWLVN